MSAGPFVRTNVKSILSPTRIYAIRVQPESIAATISPAAGGSVSNRPDPGPPNQGSTAIVGGSTRRRGFHVSVVYLALLGPKPEGYIDNSKTVIPALNLDFVSAANTPGATCDYLGTTWRVLSVRAEKSR